MSLRQIPIKQSTNILSVQYDDTDQSLLVQFQRGAIYRFEQVPGSVVNGFLSAPSVGKYFRGNVLNLYPFQQVR